MNDAKIQQEIEQALKDLASAIQYTIEYGFGKMGFALIVFEFGKPGISNYISNAERKDMIKALREMADKLEKHQDIPPSGITTIQ